MNFIATLTGAETVKRLHYDDSLIRLEDAFNEFGTSGEITYDQFQQIFKSKNPYFVERMFKIFDKDGSNTVSKDEFMSSVRSIIGKAPEEKLHWLFDIYDNDGNGTITHYELRHAIKSCMQENGLTFSDEEIDDLTITLFEDTDTDRTGTITFEAFKAKLSKHHGLIENLSLSMEQWLLPPLPTQKVQHKEKKWKIFRKLKWSYIRNNMTSATFMFIFIFVNLILFITRAFDYRDSGAFMMLARANGQCLNFTCAFILASMLRRSITYLRSLGYSEYLPLDHHVYYHKITGWFICFFSVFHTIMHLLNSVEHNNETFVTPMKSPFNNTGFVSGWILIAILAIMMIPAQSFMRTTGKFEIFYYTHLLYIAFIFILMFHGPDFWKWFLAPGFVFIAELIHRIRMYFGSDLGLTYIEKGIILPSNVIHLVIRRPTNFDYRPGDYIFVKIPKIAKYEWHPFTISSAPEREDAIWLHIRAVGEWTNRLLYYFVKRENRLHLMDKGCVNDGFSLNTESDLKNTDAENVIITGVQNNSKSYENIEENGSSVYTLTRNPIKQSLPQAIERVSFDNNKISGYNNASGVRKISAPIFGNKKFPTHKETRRASETPITVQRKISAFRRPSTVLIFPVPDDYKEVKDSETHDIEAAKSNDSVSCGTKCNSPSKVPVQSNVIHLEKPLKVHIDGPYGSPSSHIFQTEHAVMIATGIGVTPFASILQSIMYRHLKSRNVCPNCDYSWTTPNVLNEMKLKKVDFLWINRDQKSFEWFVSLLSELEIQQAEMHERDRFLDIHMYITSALDKSDIKSIGLQLALDLMHEKDRRDLITGLKTRTRPGRPKWERFFHEIQVQRKGKVTVFYCGPSELGKILHANCNRFGFQFRKETF